MLIARIYLCVK